MDNKIRWTDFVLVFGFIAIVFGLIFTSLTDYSVEHFEICALGSVEDKAVFVQYVDDYVVVCSKSVSLGGREIITLKELNPDFVTVHQVLDLGCEPYCLVSGNELTPKQYDVYIPVNSEVLKND